MGSTVKPIRTAVVAATLAAALAGVVVVTPRAGAAAPVPLFEQIDTLDRFPQDARDELGEEYVPTWEEVTAGGGYATHRSKIGAIVVPEVRQLWQIYYTSTFEQPVRFAAVVRDLDTLVIVKTLRFGDRPDGSTVQPRRTTKAGVGGDWAHVVDAAHERLFLLTDQDRSVLEIDLRTFAVAEWPLIGQTLAAFPFAVGGMSYDPYHDDLLLLYGGIPNNSEGNINTFVYTLDVSGTPPGPGTATTAHTAQSSLRQMRSCTAPVTSTDVGGQTYNWDILVTKEHLYVPCQRAGHTGIVVRTARATAAEPQPAEASAAGPTYVEAALADQAGGRLVMTNHLDKEIWVFEAATMSFVGIAATGPPGRQQVAAGFGLDPATGRVFFQSPTFGLGVVEARFFPLPQGRRAPERRARGQERILSDARTNRVFVLEGSGGDKAPAYRIYRTAPAPVPPPAPDPDRNTADVDERPGVTEARFNATASGYGARVVWAKGFATVPPAPTVGVLAPTVGVVAQGPACGFTDREFVAGRVARTEYDTGSTAAEAVAVDADGATKQDLDKPSRCDFNFRKLLGPFDGATARDDPETKGTQETRWGWKRASCSASEGGKDESAAAGPADADAALGRDLPPAGEPTPVSLGPSKVSCPIPGGVLTAEATGRLDGGTDDDDEAPLRVGRAWTSTKVERAAGGTGVRSTATSVAQDVRLAVGGLVVTFAEVRSTAGSFANGRPQRDDMSTHEVSIRGARIDGDPVGLDTCGDRGLACIVDRLNEAAAGRAQFRTGAGTDSGRDEALLRGSRRGAQSAVQKSAARQASDRSLTGDFTVEVPALEITTFNDNTEWGRARQLYQLAGVASSATYNVVARPGGVPFADLGPFDGAFGEVAGADAGLPAPAGSFGDAGTDGTSFDGVPAAAGRTGDGDDGGGFWAPLRALARGLRLFLTDPRHALLLLTAWALLGLPGALSRRRRLLTVARGG